MQLNWLIKWNNLMTDIEIERDVQLELWVKVPKIMSLHLLTANRTVWLNTHIVQGINTNLLPSIDTDVLPSANTHVLQGINTRELRLHEDECSSLHLQGDYISSVGQTVRPCTALTYLLIARLPVCMDSSEQLLQVMPPPALHRGWIQIAIHQWFAKLQIWCDETER
mgnify:CR=1 FL=1